MSPQRCLSALRALRSDLDRASRISENSAAPHDRGLPDSDEELISLRSGLQLNIDLRNDSGEPLQMTSIERTIYLPLIISVLKLLNRIQHLVPDDARDLLEEALGRVDGALAQLAKNEESQGAPPLR